jgi:hypothetical protein
VSLVATELERHGLPTAAIRFRRGAVESLPPRAVLAQFRHGFPNDPVNDPGRLLSMMEAAVNLLEEADIGPALRDYGCVDPGDRKDR